MALLTFYQKIPQIDGLNTQLMDFMRKIQENPDHSGLDLKIPKGAADKNVRTARVNDKYRAVLFEVPNPGERHFVLAGVFNHDDAYDYASKTVFTTNPINGIPQLTQTGRSQAEINAEVESRLKAREAEEAALRQVEAEAVAASSSTEVAVEEPVVKVPAAEPTPSEQLAELEIDVEQLEQELGISPVTTGIVAKAKDLADLDALLSASPTWERDAILGVLAGLDFEAIREELGLNAPADSAETAADDDEKLRKSLETPTAAMDFVPVPKDASDEDLEALISKISFSDWRTYLHPSQQKIVDADHSGSARVTGGAGTGKTIVAVHRANALATKRGKQPELGPGSPKVFLTTYTRALSDSLKSLMNLLNPTYPEASVIGAPGMWINGIDSTIHSVLKNARKDERTAAIEAVTGIDARGTGVAGLDGRDETKLWNEAVELAGEGLAPEKANAEFLNAEYSAVILAQQITDEKTYLRARRRGRGTSLDRKERKLVWSVVETFLRKALAMKRLPFATLASVAAEILNRRGVPIFDHAIVDEAQDFHAGHWRFLRAAVRKGPNDIFIAEDSHQRIYGQHLTMSHFDITIRGRASRKLTRNYRTTHETLNYALKILEGEDWRDSSDEEDTTTGYRSLRNGPEPIVVHVATESEQMDAVISQLHSWQDAASGEANIGVLVRGRADVRKVTAALTSAGFDATDTRQATVAADHDVSVMTMHSAKGLEFTHVVLLGVNAKSMPQAFRLNGLAEAERDDVLQRERALLYVAASRARDALMITAVGEASELLPAE
ncbi:3'-5' exonuclease [Corynebacterium lubricantis]|uniref:3'-5' exonuclease n=1 Tax=Corynebacterium lubricantis TaxID=541095 RepID=UPI0003764344|nr:3'-5' exonuclease [Corynebacterium lubricantis]